MGEQGRDAEWHQMDRLFPYAKVFWIKPSHQNNLIYMKIQQILSLLNSIFSFIYKRLILIENKGKNPCSTIQLKD